jgi:glycosyltransferase involved in cell wall biosynthesis
MIIPRLSDLDLTSGLTSKPLKVCIVSSEFIGPVKNGGIATATSALVKHLTDDGHRVTLLYTLVEGGNPTNIAEQDGSKGQKRSWQYWVGELARQGIALEYIPNTGGYSAFLQKSWLVKEYIGKRDFDLVYFDDWHGSAYYSLVAKRVGLAPFSTQLHCVITHASREWVYSINEQHIRGLVDIEVCGLERRSVEMADVVIGPSRYLLHEYAKYGWHLPARTYCQPFPLVQASVEPSEETVQIQELVFFGRLETRKGLWLFCEALDVLADRLREKTVTFLGKITDAGVSSGLQLLNRSSKWPFRVRLLTDYDRDAALNYLKQGNKLAVIPSLADNSPCVIHECMEAGVPFVSTLGSGIQELVDPKCWPQMMVRPTVNALTERLAQILDDGARLGRPSVDPQENNDAWSAWHRHVAGNRANLIRTTPSSQAGKMVTQTNAGERKLPLLVMIDEGNCALQLLIENLATHVKRFSGFAAHIVISSRRDGLQEALFDLFKGTQGPSVRFFDTSGIDEARKIIGKAEFAFFMNADVEMLTPFFVLALDALAREKSAVVTSIGAVRDNRLDDANIEELPTGDVPALSALGRPIGGPIWAASPASLSEEFSSLEFYNKRLDELASSWFLGELLMNRRRMTNGAVELLPIVGAISTRGQNSQLHVMNNQEIRLTAATLGIPRSIYAGGAPWFAISSFGTKSEQPEQTPRGFPLLPSDHPLSVLDARGADNDLAVLSAAVGRTGLALQLQASQGGSAERVQELIDIALDAARRRPAFDLAEALANGNLMEFGRNSFPQKAERKTQPPQRSDASGQPIAAQSSLARNANGVESEERVAHAADAIGIYVESRLRVTGRKIQSVATLLSGGPGRLYFIDVPLCGNSFLSAKFRSGARNPLLVRIKAIDGVTGEQMSATFAHLNANETVKMSLPLYEIHGRAAFLFEFSGAANIQVIAEEIRVQ